MTIVDDPAAPAPAKPKRAPKPKAQAVTIQTPCPPMAPQDRAGADLHAGPDLARGV